MSAELWLDQLQENGYRLTEARRAVVNLVAGASGAR
jgi:Fe2+ or Zn2+ uptake regulation protein